MDLICKRVVALVISIAKLMLTMSSLFFIIAFFSSASVSADSRFTGNRLITAYDENATEATFKDIVANGHTFPLDSGFPVTGFTGATFTIEINNGNATDYLWLSSVPLVSVKDGVVKFLGEIKFSNVVVVAIPKQGGKVLSYNFELKDWYINDGPNSTNWYAARHICNQRGYDLATVSQLNGSKIHSAGTRGTTGSLWGEWGDLGIYAGSGFVSYYYYWTLEDYIKPDHHYDILLGKGSVTSSEDTSSLYTVCRKTF